MSRISTADSDLIALHNTTVLEKNMYFLNFTCYIVKLERDALIVGKCILIPVLYDCLLNICIKTAKSIH